MVIVEDDSWGQSVGDSGALVGVLRCEQTEGDSI